MARVYVGNLDSLTTERDLEDEFRVYGVLRSVWVARKPPGYAFIEFDDRRDAFDAIDALDGKKGWRVEMSRNSRAGGRGRGGGDDSKCYECGEPGHFARECHLRIGSGGLGSGRHRSPSPRYRRSPSYGRSYSPVRSSGSYRRRARSPSYSPYDRGYGNGKPHGRSRSPRRSCSPRRRSYSPRRRSYSPRRRSYSSRRGRSRSRSPPAQSPITKRQTSPYNNGSPANKDSY